MKDIATPVAITRHRSAEDLPAAASADTGKATLPMRLFVGVVVIHVALTLCLQPTWVWSGAMLAEMATNYYDTAEKQPLARGLLATDYGYIPLPPRLLATAGRLLRLPAAAVPFFYTWSAILLSGGLVASFCLREFRRLIPSDWQRFVAAVCMACAGDFDVRTFINFANYAAFPILAIAALAVVDRERPPPRWSWLVPLFMISKPAMLATVPAVMAAACFGGARWRAMTLIALVLAAVQVIQLVFSQGTAAGVAPLAGSSLIQRLCTIFDYLPYGTTCILVGRWVPRNPVVYIPLFFGIVTVGAWLVRLSSDRCRALITFGALAIFGNIVINCIAIASEWGPNLVGLHIPTVNRRTLVAFAGATIALTGVFATVAQRALYLGRVPAFGSVALATWFMLSGWLSHGLRAAREPGSPVLGNSYWQEMADAIDTRQSLLFVPIDPFGWSFSRNCHVLAKPANKPFVFQRTPIDKDGYAFVHVAPPEVATGELHAIGVLLRPASQVRTHIEATAVLTMQNGEIVTWRGSRDIRCTTGGLILIGAERDTLVSGVREIAIRFDVPVEIARTTEDDTGFLMWIGRAKPSIPN